jgi:hypothetical protein
VVVYKNNGTGVHNNYFLDGSLYFVFHNQGISHFLLGQANFPLNLFPIAKLKKGEEILYVILLSFCDNTLLLVSKTVSVQEGKPRIRPSNVLGPGLMEAQGLPLFL